MALDVLYTNGVIAVREKNLLKDKLLRLCELSAKEAFRMLLESGFGGAEAATDVYEYEKLIAVEEDKLDAFILEYAPSKGEAEYLLSPRDFHNAKALIKAKYLGESADKMLAPEGLITIERLRTCVQDNDFSPLAEYPLLQEACLQASELLETEPSGAKTGDIFQKALYAHLFKSVKNKGALKKILVAKSDMINILTAVRSGEREIAFNKYLPTGKLSAKELDALFDEDKERAVSAFKNTPYYDFVKLCLDAKERGLPLTEAEKILGGYDTAYFSARKHELKRSEPFLYYVYRRKAECANVRVIFVCLLAGLSEQDIKRRLRAF